jgi:PAS domain S-box-containing protein
MDERLAWHEHGPHAPDTAEVVWDIAFDLLCVVGFDGRIQHASRSWTTTLGYPLDELIGAPHDGFVHPDDVHLARSAARTLPDGRNVLAYAQRWRHKDGSWRRLRWQAVPCPERQATWAAARDVTDEDTRLDVGLRLVTAVEQAADAIFITDAAGTIVYCNQAFEQTTGYSADEAVGRRPGFLRSGVHDAAFYDELWTTIRAGRTWHGRITNRRRDGSLYVVRATITPLFDATGQVAEYVATQQDITAELDLQQRLARAEAMRAVGQLVAGVAHDFKNLLTGVRSFAQVASQTCGDRPEMAEPVRDLDAIADRGMELIQQLVDFVRQDAAEPTAVDLNQVVRDAARLLRRTFDRGIQIRLDLAPDLPPLRIVPVRLQQVLLNLALNARDAMPTGGCLTIGTARAEQPGEVLLAVSDTGCGIPPELRDRVFDPFFTTRRAAGGTGLGLATVADIVRASRGRIDVDSAPECGTVFRLYLPADA